MTTPITPASIAAELESARSLQVARALAAKACYDGSSARRDTLYAVAAVGGDERVCVRATIQPIATLVTDGYTASVQAWLTPASTAADAIRRGATPPARHAAALARSLSEPAVQSALRAAAIQLYRLARQAWSDTLLRERQIARLAGLRDAACEAPLLSCPALGPSIEPTSYAGSRYTLACDRLDAGSPEGLGGSLVVDVSHGATALGHPGHTLVAHFRADPPATSLEAWMAARTRAHRAYLAARHLAAYVHERLCDRVVQVDPDGIHCDAVVGRDAMDRPIIAPCVLCGSTPIQVGPPYARIATPTGSRYVLPWRWDFGPTAGGGGTISPGP